MSSKTARASVLRGDAAFAVESALTPGALDELTTTVRAQMTQAEMFEADRAEAFRQGYNDGLAAAREEVAKAMDDSAKSVRRALAALCEAVDSFDARQTIALADVEDAIVAGAFELSRAVLQREIAVATTPGADALARAMKLAPNRGNVTARLHPEDAATLSITDVSTSTRTVEVIADAGVERGGCIVEVGETRVDAQLSSALANVQSALFGNVNEAAGRGSTSSGTTASEAHLA